MKNLFPIISLLLLTACGAGSNTDQPESAPVAMAPAMPVVAVNPVTMPEPVVVVMPMPEVVPAPVAETPPDVVMPQPTVVAVERTFQQPLAPAGMYVIYRQEMTNSPTPWYEVVGTFATLAEANARFTTGEGLMWREEYQYIIGTSNPTEFYSYNWQRLCIEC